MREIEVKAKVSNFKKLIEKLENLGCKISKPIIQNDIIFFQSANNSGPKSILRIRKSNNKILFTLKQNKSNELDCLEKEVEIFNAREMEEIVELLGYIEGARVNKIRRKCKLNDYEICLDEVDGLGNFIEVEKISDEDGETVQKELFDFLLSLGVNSKNRVTRGYDTLIMLKNGGDDKNYGK